MFDIESILVFNKKKRIQIQIYASVLQIRLVTLSPYNVLVLYKIDGWLWVHSLFYSFTKCMGDIGAIRCASVLENGGVTLGPFYVLVLYKMVMCQFVHSMD